MKPGCFCAVFISSTVPCRSEAAHPLERRGLVLPLSGEGRALWRRRENPHPPLLQVTGASRRESVRFLRAHGRGRHRCTAASVHHLSPSQAPPLRAPPHTAASKLAANPPKAGSLSSSSCVWKETWCVACSPADRPGASIWLFVFRGVWFYCSNDFFFFMSAGSCVRERGEARSGQRENGEHRGERKTRQSPEPEQTPVSSQVRDHRGLDGRRF